MIKLQLYRVVATILMSSLIVACNDKTSTEIEAPVSTKAGKSGYSNSPGVLTPYIPPNETLDSSGRKLFAIYMVGSDLEDQGSNEYTGWGAGSLDFGELVDGYNKVSAEPTTLLK